MLLSEVLQMPEKQWTPDINPVMATLTVVGQYSQGTYGFEQPVQLKDDAQVSSEITVQSKYEKGLMAPNMVGRRARWRLKWFSFKGGRKIVGYCLDKMDGSQQAPITTPQPQQYPSQAAQRPDTPQPRDYDAENRGKCRFGIVCAYISAGVEPDIPTVNYWVEYSMTGQAPVPPGHAQDMHGQDMGIPPWEH